MNGDALEIMNAIGTMHADLQKQIGEIKSDISGMQGDLNARIVSLEVAESRGFWTDFVRATVGAAPLVGLHMLLHRMGFKI
jgi:hypothetical protein